MNGEETVEVLLESNFYGVEEEIKESDLPMIVSPTCLNKKEVYFQDYDI